MKVAIVTDSLTNLTAADLDRYPDVYYGYLNVIVNDKAYAEQKEINNKELFRMIDEGATYSTSQPAPEEFVQLYTKLLQDYDYILEEKQAKLEEIKSEISEIKAENRKKVLKDVLQ